MTRARRQLVLVSIAGLGVAVAGADFLARQSGPAEPPEPEPEPKPKQKPEPEPEPEPRLAPNLPEPSVERNQGLAAALRALDRRAGEIDPDAIDRLFGLEPLAPTRRAERPGPTGRTEPADPTTPAPPAAPSPASLRLSAVSTTGGGSAVINGQIYRVGEPSDGIELISVTGRTARVVVGGDAIDLVLRPPRSEPRPRR